MSIARKNGKTALIAALVLVHLIGPEAILNGEIYSAANEREQAAIVFKVARQIVELDPELAVLVKVVPSTKTLVCYANGSFYRAISSEAGSKHGLNPSVVIYDELAQAKNRELFDALDTSMGARKEPLFVVISTQSADPEHILSKLIDDGLSGSDPTTVCHLYAVPDDEPDIYNEKKWYLANPALGKFRSLEDLRALAGRAKRMPSFESAFRNLYLNQRVSLTESIITRADWLACAGAAEFVDGEAVYLGLDLSVTTDLTALVMVSAENGSRIKAWFWKPKDTLDEHQRRDRVPYDVWAKQGWLTLGDGRTVDEELIVNTIAEVADRYDVKCLAYDRYRMESLLKVFARQGLEAQKGEGPGLHLMDFGQGFISMAPAIDALEKAVIDGELKHPSNPVLTWNISNAVATTDAAGNRKMDKAKARFRIDGAVALVMALGSKSKLGDVVMAVPGIVFL